jgi:hypothetical protein
MSEWEQEIYVTGKAGDMLHLSVGTKIYHFILRKDYIIQVELEGGVFEKPIATNKVQ